MCFHPCAGCPPQDPVPISKMDDWLQCKQVNITVTEAPGKPGGCGTVPVRRSCALCLLSRPRAARAATHGAPLQPHGGRSPSCPHARATRANAVTKKCRVHTVKSGETGSVIAGIFAVSLDQLSAANGGKDVSAR